ncbi:MAG: hypothetical protein R8P61_30060 [Bacteroidia bacterium]|nr:hypothetical protein [Bacteroidia bacterium]
MLLKKLHFFGGILFLIIFILSGQYMQHAFNGLQDLELFERMVFRAEHIYLLLTSLIHLSMGTYLRPYKRIPQEYIQLFSSFLMFLATASFLYSFFHEMPSSEIERPFSRMGLYLMLAGVSFHGLLSLWKAKPDSNPS